MTNLRLSVRRLLASPGFSLTAFATLALGFAAVLSVFAFVDSVLLRPLPHADSSSLLVLRQSATGLDGLKSNQSEASYLYYREHNRVFEEVGAYIENSVSITDNDDPELIRIALITPNILHTLHAEPVAGRLLTDAEGLANAPRVVVLSQSLWVRRYGSDPGIVGRSIELNHLPCLVAGVLAESFQFPRRETQLWYNLPMVAAAPSTAISSMEVIARLRPGVSVDGAAQDLRGVLGTTATAYPAVRWLSARSQPRVAVVGLKAFVLDGADRAIWLLFAVVLLVVWANVANLFLVRAEHRKQDVAVRKALGVSPGGLAGGFFCDALILVVPAVIAALTMAYVGTVWRFGLMPDQVPRLNELRLSAATWALAGALALITGTLLSGVSLWQATRGDLLSSLRGGRRMSGGGAALQRGLVSLQVAITLILLAGSAICVRSVIKLQQVAYGFATTDVLTARVSLPTREYPQYAESARFIARLQGASRQIPGVTAAGAISTLPLTSAPASIIRTFVSADGDGASIERASLNAIVVATPEYFEALQVPLITGRTFQSGDANLKESPIILSARAAGQLFGAGTAVGKQVRLAHDDQHVMYTVVGVAGDVQSDQLGRPQAVVYFPSVEDVTGTSPQRFAPRNMTLAIRTHLPAGTVMPALRNAVRQLDRRMPVWDVRTMNDILSRVTARLRVTTLFLGVAACATLFLGIVGIYAIISYTVVMRTHEIGIRLALGAEVERVIGMILTQNLKVVLVGLVAGAATTFLLAQRGVARSITRMCSSAGHGAGAQRSIRICSQGEGVRRTQSVSAANRKRPVLKCRQMAGEDSPH